MNGNRYTRVMTAYTYVLRCSDGTFYAGSTKHLEDRIEAHHQGLGSDYTTNRRPLQLIWWAEFSRIDEAFALEKQIQGWSHAKRLAFIEGGWVAIKGWSARERALRGSK
ncbi:GIY-YIG nuclease family protein [Microbacterium esteraromaticum]|uniref:GIY-YIG nuclease family protein n=2 Tax=Microbacterium esteraromaticum TaxID=57043 RepID=UPI001E030CC7|nr:putative endonuclease [Microbacterium esteraromaticum]